MPVITTTLIPTFFDIHYTEEQVLTWEVDGPEEGLFTISQQGALRFNSSAGFRWANSTIIATILSSRYLTNLEEFPPIHLL